MNKLQTLVALFAIGTSLGMGAHDAAASQKNASASAESGEPLTTEELYRLYPNRSWLWKDGSGYFPTKQRRFIARTGDGDTGSYAIGRWFLTSPGKLCFKAKWYAKGDAASALTCFSHRKNAGIVFQKREPDGDWYAFKHARTLAGDEYGKIRPGNYVGPGPKQIGVQ